MKKSIICLFCLAFTFNTATAQRLLKTNVYFGWDKAIPTDSSAAMLQQMADRLSNTKDYDFEIVGHTDGTGNKQYNQKLSERRAKYVTDFLISKGISADRITYRAEGQAKPAGDNTTKEGRALNRRVEVYARATVASYSGSKAKSIYTEFDEEGSKQVIVLNKGSEIIIRGTPLSLQEQEQVVEYSAEIQRVEDMVDNCVYTLDRQNRAISAAGMLVFNANVERTDRKIRIRIPAIEADTAMKVFVRDAGSRNWMPTQIPLKIERTEQVYYVFDADTMRDYCVGKSILKETSEPVRMLIKVQDKKAVNVVMVSRLSNTAIPASKYRKKHYILVHNSDIGQDAELISYSCRDGRLYSFSVKKELLKYRKSGNKVKIKKKEFTPENRSCPECLSKPVPAK